MQAGKGIPIDWTNGTGVIPAGGIQVAAEPYRQGIFIQNQDVGAVEIAFNCVGPTGTPTVVSVTLAPAGTAGAQGGAFDSSVSGFLVNAAFSVTGTTGKQVVVLTN
jgi:hypothetical protein